MPALGANGRSPGSNAGPGPLPPMPPWAPRPAADSPPRRAPTRSRRHIKPVPSLAAHQPEPPKAVRTTPGPGHGPQSGGWPATPSTADILDDPGPASYSSYQTPVYNGPPASASYEVSAGWGDHRRRLDHRTDPGGLHPDRPPGAVLSSRPLGRPSARSDRRLRLRAAATDQLRGAPAAWPEPPHPGSDGASWPT